MNSMYRLAVIRLGDKTEVAVEYHSKLLSLSDLGLRGETPFQDLMPILEDWPTWSGRLAEAIAASGAVFDRDGTSSEAVRFAPVLAAPGKIVCIGSNYHDHIAEMSIPMTPSYPYSFLKPANNTLRTTYDAVAVPKRSLKMDWEVELGVVIGKTCAEVKAQNALEVVAGYLNFNDLSARDWLESRPPIGVDWVQHKAFDGFAPLGPYFIPRQFVADPQSLPLRLSVNGVLKQDSNTDQMVFSVAEIIAHLTSIMTLHPGDIIATGTPAGVGHGKTPPEYLKAGDEIRMEVADFGELVTPIV